MVSACCISRKEMLRDQVALYSRTFAQSTNFLDLKSFLWFEPVGFRIWAFSLYLVELVGRRGVLWEVGVTSGHFM